MYILVFLLTLIIIIAATIKNACSYPYELGIMRPERSKLHHLRLNKSAIKRASPGYPTVKHTEEQFRKLRGLRLHRTS